MNRRGRRSGSAGSHRGVPARAAAIGLDRRPQLADRHSLGRGQCRAYWEIRRGTGRARARCRSRSHHCDGAGGASSQPDHAGRFYSRDRSGERRPSRKPGAPGWQCDRIYALDFADYSLTDVVQTVCTAVEPLAADKKLALKVKASTDLPAGRGDERRLTQVLLNLVGNAIKFTDAGEVVITAAASNGSFNVSVKDTGRGYRRPIRPSYSRNFSRRTARSPARRAAPAWGLRSPSASSRCTGGEFGLISIVGQGSTFSFTLPVCVEQQVEAA